MMTHKHSVNGLRGWTLALLLWMAGLLIAATAIPPLAFPPYLAELVLLGVVIVFLWERWSEMSSVAVLGLAFGMPLVGETLARREAMAEPALARMLAACLAIGGVMLLVQKVLGCVKDFEAACQQLLTAQAAQQRISPLEVGQTELYRNVRRARKYGRPLSVLRISADPPSVQQRLHPLLEEAQRATIQQYVQARIADVLCGTLHDCDLIAKQDDAFIVMMPETDAAAASHVGHKLTRAIQDDLGISLRVGLSSFPDAESTLYGLLQGARDDMHQARHSDPQPGPPPTTVGGQDMLSGEDMLYGESAEPSQLGSACPPSRRSNRGQPR